MTEKNKKRTKDLFILGGEAGYPDKFTFKRVVEQNIIDIPRKGMDDFPLDYPPNREVLKETKRIGLFNGFRLNCNPTEENFSDCEPGKYYFIMDLLRATIDYQRPGVKEKFPDYNAFLEDYYDRIFDIINAHPDTAWVCAVGEMDSSCPWPAHNFRTKDEALKYWKDVFFSKKVGSNDPEGLHRYFKSREIDYRKANVIVHCAMVFSVHHYFDWGFRFVWMERGCGLSNVQMGIAFLRGAARQYSGLWGLDFSTHHPQRNQLTWYDEQGRRRGGWTESLMIRSWMAAYLSGANFVHEEGENYTHWIFDSKGNFKLSPAGRLSQRFADFTLREHTERGATYAPVAMLVAFHHGYDGRHSIALREPYLWGGRIAPGPDDRNIDNIIEMFFPRHNKSWGMFDEAFNPSVPWKSEGEYLQMLKDGYDMRPFEEGHLVTSPYGDILDVLVDTADRKNLGRYPLIFMGGLTGYQVGREKELKAYIETGGTLAGSYEQFPQEILEELGIVKRGSGWDYDKIKCTCCGNEYGGNRYGFLNLDVPVGKVLCTNHNGIPLAWEIAAGKGRIILSAVPYCQDIPGSAILPVFRHIFGELIAPLCIVSADPADLQVITNTGDGFILTGVFNNTANPWNGAIRINKQGRIAGITDVWNKAPVFAGEINTPMEFRDTINPFDFKVYRVALQKYVKGGYQ